MPEDQQEIAKDSDREGKKEEAGDNTESESAARAFIAALRDAAPDASKDAVAKAVKTADSDQAAQELLTQAINAVPAATAEAAFEDARLTADIQHADHWTSMWIWKVTVSIFAFVLVVSVLTLCAATLWYPDADTQIVLTVVTTTAGILAGFITGRASGGGPR